MPVPQTSSLSSGPAAVPPRSSSLGQSSRRLPSLLGLLLSPRPTPEAAPAVVGHARLSRVLDRPQTSTSGAVVVARALRTSL